MILFVLFGGSVGAVVFLHTQYGWEAVKQVDNDDDEEDDEDDAEVDAEADEGLNQEEKRLFLHTQYGWEAVKQVGW